MYMKLTPYYISLAVYCVTVFLVCGALQTASDEIRDAAALEAQAINYMKQDLAQLVSMRI